MKNIKHKGEAIILNTDSKNNKAIDNNLYTAVEVTSDGRCFFGSVALAYRINKGELYTETLIDNVLSTLNDWIRENLIEVVENNPTECATLEAIAANARRLLYKSVPDDKSNKKETVTIMESAEKENEETETAKVFENAVNQIDLTFPENLTKCPYENPDEMVGQIEELKQNKQFTLYQSEFVSFCHDFNTKESGKPYEYAEPEVIGQILSNKLNQHICVVSNTYNVIKTYYSNYINNEELPTIYVKKLDIEHYYALIPATKIPTLYNSDVNLRIKYKRCEIKDLPSTGWRGSFGSSKTNRIIGENSSDTENVVSKVNKTISEKSDFNNFSIIGENDVQVIDDQNNTITNGDFKNANENWYFLVNLKEKEKSRRGGRYNKKSRRRRLTRKKKHIQQRKSKKRQPKTKKH